MRNDSVMYSCTELVSRSSPRRASSIPRPVFSAWPVLVTSSRILRNSACALTTSSRRLRTSIRICSVWSESPMVSDLDELQQLLLPFLERAPGLVVQAGRHADPDGLQETQLRRGLVAGVFFGKLEHLVERVVV